MGDDDKMTYEEWLISIKFGLKRRYKIEEISCDNYGMIISFKTNFVYRINIQGLIGLWNHKKSAFDRLCTSIESAYLNQIINI